MNTAMVWTAIVCGLITWLFMYLDARLFDTPKSKFTYVKGISFVVLVSVLIVYFMPAKTVLQSGGIPQMGTTIVPGIGQEIITGIPNF